MFYYGRMRKLVIITAVFVLATALFLCGCNNKRTSTPDSSVFANSPVQKDDIEINYEMSIASAVPDYTMTVDQLYDEYYADEIADKIYDHAATDEKYEDKIILLTGKAGDFYKTTFGEDFIFVIGSLTDLHPASIVCIMSYNGQLDSLTMLQPITIQGMWNGDFGGDPSLEHCVLK